MLHYRNRPRVLFEAIERSVSISTPEKVPVKDVELFEVEKIQNNTYLLL